MYFVRTFLSHLKGLLAFPSFWFLLTVYSVCMGIVDLLTLSILKCVLSLVMAVASLLGYFVSKQYQNTHPRG